MKTEQLGKEKPSYNIVARASLFTQKCITHPFNFFMYNNNNIIN